MKPLHIFTCCMMIIICGCTGNADRKSISEIPKANKFCSPAPKTDDREWYESGKKAPLFSGLDGIEFEITANSEEAKKYFRQGMMLSYGFNHAEAARSFFEASRIDSTCAMCYWGFAYVLGPNYNAGMEEDNFERAYLATQKALQYAPLATEKEQALITAVAKRYPKEPVDDRSEYDRAYADAMREVHRKFPDDDDIATLLAEALMDLHPWDLHDKEGKPKEWTPEIIALLEGVMKKSPRHAGSNHLYIHAVEASSTPERGLPSADLLLTLVPGAGHLVHMPSHIYIRTGHYHEGSLSNIKAGEVDSLYVAACNAQGAYPLVYFPHTIHFLAATATLEGNSEWAMQAARSVAKHTYTELMNEPFWDAIMQHFYSIPLYVAVKFAKWDDIFNDTKELNEYPYIRGIQHYARGMAFLNKNESEKAQAELAALKVIAADTVLADMIIWEINSIQAILQIAEKVLEGELSAAAGNYDAAIQSLREGVTLEDGLNYIEPPDWFFSVRHHLGAVQLQAGKFADAQKTFEQDLKVLRENGWALSGLVLALEKQGKQKEAADVRSRFEKSWQWATVKIDGGKVI